MIVYVHEKCFVKRTDSTTKNGPLMIACSKNQSRIYILIN